MSAKDTAARRAGGRPRWFYHDAAKIVMILACCFCLLSSLFSIISVILLAEFGFYTGTFDSAQKEVYTRFGESMAEATLRDAYESVIRREDLEDGLTEELMEQYDAAITQELLLRFGEKNVLLTVTDAGGNVIASTYDGQEIQYQGETSIFLQTETEIELYTLDSSREEEDEAIAVDRVERPLIERFVQFVIPVEKEGSGLFYIMDLWLAQVYGQRFALIVLGFPACVVSGILFVFLLCVAGRHPEERRAKISTFDRLPADLMVALYAVFGYYLWRLILAVTERWEPVLIVPGALLICLSAPLILLFSMSFATRCKCGTLLKNTLSFRLLSLLGRALRWLWLHAVCPVGRTIHAVIAGLPIIWKTTLAAFAVALAELLTLLLVHDSALLLVLWAVETAILTLLALWISLIMRRLQKGGEALSRGELQYKIDEEHLPGDFRQHARDLNSISQGMSRALEERFKSERLRTELITNVSHDIKTPLTTIISYVNLLQQERFESPAAMQYLATLDRQSTRLKKLMEDLVEVSKASTGSLTVNAAPCRLEVLLSQALGEYEARMFAADLTPVLHTSSTATVLADGRLLWRVFDNLLSNAVKYAMPGTRIYIDVIEEATDVTLVFRNISKEELNIPADDLLERFVRGDRSRHTEGSGLGLSIALSLTELMGGTLSLEVDGDLFKVSLVFPSYEGER